MRQYTIHRDPGHGWLAVPKKECLKLLIMAKISPYSYVSKSGKTIYLEEDCDAGLFIEAFKKKYGVEPRYRDSKNKKTYTQESHIRRLPSYPQAYWASLYNLAIKELKNEFSNVIPIRKGIMS